MTSLYRPTQNGMPGRPPVTRITIARGAKDYEHKWIPELAAEKARLAEVDKTPIAPIRLKKLENRSAPKEIRSSYPGSPVARVERQIEEKQRRLNLWDKDPDQRDKEIMDLKDRVTLLDRLNTKMEEEKDEKQAKLMSLQLLLSQREAEKRELEHIVSRLEIHNSRIEEEVGSKEAKLRALYNEINQREREKTELREEVSALKRQKVEATESKAQKEQRLKQLEAEIASREQESQELRNKVASLEKVTENIEKEKEEKEEKLATLEEIVQQREQERKDLEEKVVLLEARNQQIEEEKKNKEERLRELEAQQGKKGEEQSDGELNGGDTVDAGLQAIDKETKEKLKKLEELEAAMMQHEAEREELQQLVKSLQQRNTQMDEEKEEKQRQLIQLQLAVAKKDTENYELKQKLIHLETVRGTVQMKMAEERDTSEDLQNDQQVKTGPDDVDGSSDTSLTGGQVDRASAPSAHSDKYVRPHSPLFPLPSLSTLTAVPYIAEHEALKYKLQRKYLLREEEVQERHVYLPEEKDPSVQNLDTPDAQSVQDHDARTFPTVQEESTPNASARSSLSDIITKCPESPEPLAQNEEVAAQYKTSEKLATEPQDRSRSASLTAEQPETQEITARTNAEGEAGDDEEEAEYEGDEDDDEDDGEERAIMSVTEEEITRTRQKLEEIEIEVVQKKAESEYLRRSVEDLLSLMEAAEGEEENNDELDLDDSESEASSSEESDEYFVEVDSRDPNSYFCRSPDHPDDVTDGAKTPSTAPASPSPEDVTEVKRKLENLEQEILDKKIESERIKRTMEDLRLHKMVAAEEKKLTKQKLDDLQRSEAQLKQLLAILQLRRATESEERNADDQDDDEKTEGRMEEDAVEMEAEGHGELENISEEDCRALRDAIVY